MAENPQDRQKLRIPGIEIREPEFATLSWQNITLKEPPRTFRLSTTREGATDAPVIDTVDDDVIEIELENGARFWTSRQRLTEELLPAVERRGVDGVIDLPANLPIQGPSRGPVGAVVIKTLRLFRINVPRLAAQTIAARWENSTLYKDAPGPGLYRCAASGPFALSPLTDASGPFPTDRPALLLLHGTASSTRGSFSALWEQKWKTSQGPIAAHLFRHYQGHVYAFEHRTLTASPIQNAIALVKKLPPAARLHVISHSRGGLVGELLCRTQMADNGAPFDKEDLALFAARDPEGARGDLKQLNELLQAKQLRVERFVRVACPARGTTLASERFDIYLSVIFNLLQEIPGFSLSAGGVAYDILTELIMAIAKERADPGVLPGIEAMIPTSPLIALLNLPGRAINSELRVIAGDIEGGNLSSTLGALLTDPLYQGDNDLVVDTNAMFGGTERTGTAGFSFYRGPEVSHFQYFRNEDSAAQLVKALTRQPEQDDGFTPYDIRETDSGVPVYRGEIDRPRPVVFLLPGIMGSHLAQNNERIWIDLGKLARGGLSRLAIDAPNVTAEDLVALAYGSLAKFLSATHEVVPFPYDWRLSLRTEAKRLANELEEKLTQAESNNQPVSLLAHSMGGLLARVMIADHPQVWQRLCKHADARLIMLGTPNGGSYVIPLVLTGRETLIRQLSLLDIKHFEHELLDIIYEYPGLLEMLPLADEQDDPYTFFSPDTWNAIHARDKGYVWTAPTAARLTAARETRRLLNQSPTDPERMCYVAGCAPATPVGFQFVANRQGREILQFQASPQGDGRVLWATGRLAGVQTWYMQAVHGDLANHEPAFPALLDLLQKGATTRLPTVPPETRGAPERFLLPEEKKPLYPDFEDLTRAALGSNRRVSKRKPEHRVRVVIAHGNLAYASHPIMVGHYRGDTIISAEAYLDRVLGGRLRDRLRLNLYPGELETEAVILNLAEKPPGAIIIGLGTVGTLSPGGLTRAIDHGVRAYAITLAESAAAGTRSSLPYCPGKVSSVLIGTGAGGMPVNDAVLAILRGLAHANQALEESGYADRVRIEEIEFVELYEDRAIQAAHALTRLKNSDVDIARQFDIESPLRVKTLRGGRRRARFTEDDSWWHPLQILEDERKGLTFNFLTDRARTEEYLQPTQRALVDQFLNKATQETSTNTDVAVTLFELLVPNPLKDYAPDQRNLLLVLNEAAAHYPWELMQERQPSTRSGASGRKKPLAIQAGLVRQLQSTEFREKIAPAQGYSALVVGDPPSRFAPLPGAVREARNVTQQLKEWNYAVTSIVRQDEAEIADDILNALYVRDYRIVHLAGHGVYRYVAAAPDKQDAHSPQPPEEPRTGMVIGDDKFLTPAEFEKMRAVPELVFINCCHLGNIEDSSKYPTTNPPRLAANVATEFIRMGVRAVVAAGWAVDDDAAQLFARTFYQEMLAGASFGNAVKTARQTTFDAYPSVNTWGAYQCYGDPAFTLSADTPAETTDRRVPPFATPYEAIVELDNIAEDAATASDTELVTLTKRVKDINTYMPAPWLNDGAVRAALGRAYGELDLFAEAVEHYTAALHAEKTQFPLRAIEQLCNLQARNAVQRATAPDATAATRKTALDSIETAKARLDNLIATVGKTAERLSLKGSIAKRQAMVARTLNEKRRALREMANCYEEAYTLCHTLQNQINPYPLLNWMTAEVLLWLLGPNMRKPANLQQLLEQARTASAERDRSDPNFWDASAQVEAQLMEHVAAGDLLDHVDDIVSGYKDARNRDASPREFRSVLEQLDFLATIVAAARNNREKTRLNEALKKIRQELAQ
jgi:CHAT domain-containing protein/pimeloyl-ACP methyl ester carboxylesterase